MIPIYAGELAIQRLDGLNELASSVDPAVEQAVASIVEQVRQQGDKALRNLAKQLGDPCPQSFRLNAEMVTTAVARVPAATRKILEEAAQNIEAFAQAVMAHVQGFSLDRSGWQVGLDWRPVERVGCYVPAGRYPLPSTALMTSITAKVAGVSHITLISPRLDDAIIYAGTLGGVTDFYQVGGAQAVAALAYGTETIQAVDMVVGPGNRYVAEAKRQLQGVVGIDMLAGPSELTIIADQDADPAWVAWDLLAQAEHDPQSRVYLLTDNLALAKQVQEQIQQILNTESLADFLPKALLHSGLFVLDSLTQCVAHTNRLAPEHLELHVKDPAIFKPNLHHYGALFMGYSNTVPFGDYLAGPNHTLPTGRSARFSGSLTPLTFLRPQTWIHTPTGVSQLAQTTHDFAQLEGLTAHALAAKARLNPIS